MKIGILGGGIAGVSLSIFLKDKYQTTILEKSNNLGGLARSYKYKGFYYDIGPHIIFSNNSEILKFMLEVGKDNLKNYKRSNQIWIDGKLIKYPFENFLGLLNKDDNKNCLNDFLLNPYKNLTPQNMHQFFLKKFGYGISEKYLLPYNRKIWKFDPSFLDLQMVNRIPDPPPQDVIRGSKSDFVEGYTHQLSFYYPKSGGIGSFYRKLFKKIPQPSIFLKNHKVIKIKKLKNKWLVKCENEENYEFDKIINCMPIHEFIRALSINKPKNIIKSLNQLRFNSMYVGIIIFKEDNLGENFSLNIPDPNIIFHRISKLNFIGENNPQNQSAFLFEITYSKNTPLSQMNKLNIKQKVIDGFEKMGIAKTSSFIGFQVRNIEKAYVVYDLNHRKNVDNVLNFLKENDILSCGRFAEFEYMNMDHVIQSAQKTAEKLNSVN